MLSIIILLSSSDDVSLEYDKYDDRLDIVESDVVRLWPLTEGTSPVVRNVTSDEIESLWAWLGEVRRHCFGAMLSPESSYIVD